LWIHGILVPLDRGWQTGSVPAQWARSISCGRLQELPSEGQTGIGPLETSLMPTAADGMRAASDMAREWRGLPDSSSEEVRE
jgi:hypothetical protein